jgi:predicted NBD/HSP70 family sugar kinase
MTSGEVRSGERRESATVQTLRQVNRAQVLTEVILAGAISRSEIAERTGLSLASVTKMLAELTGDGLVTDVGSRSSRGGRPITVMSPAKEGALFIGADVGERGVAVELFDLSMTRIDREFRGGHEEERADAIARDLTEAIAALEVRHRARWDTLRGIGLGLPGLVEGAPGPQQTLYAQTLGWDPLPVSQLVPEATVPIYADNGAKTLAKAEQWFGGARGLDYAVIALLGRGVGMGLIAGGSVLRGSASTATEWGHVKVALDGRRCRCGARGCLEAYVGADAILSQWAERGGSFEGSGWRAIGALIDAAAAGDSDAAEVVEEVVARLGQALGGMVNFANPQRVVVGGWVGLRLMETLGDRIIDATRANALARPGEQFDLVAASFGGDTVALGAAIMPLEALIEGHGDSK